MARATNPTHKDLVMPQKDDRLAAAEATIQRLELALAELATVTISPANAQGIRARKPNLASVLDGEMKRVQGREAAVPSLAGRERRADG